MSKTAKPIPEPRRRNKAVGVADALGRVLDPVLKKRGFASRDIFTHWTSMAPSPYGQVAYPDKLAWPRGDKQADRGAQGATLYLRCVPGHAMAIAHEAPAIAAAVNRYFGYLLVGQVRLSIEPFTPGSVAKSDKGNKPSETTLTTVSETIAHVEDDDLREALRTLGHALLSKSDPSRR